MPFPNEFGTFHESDHSHVIVAKKILDRGPGRKPANAGQFSLSVRWNLIQIMSSKKCQKFDTQQAATVNFSV